MMKSKWSVLLAALLMVVAFTSSIYAAEYKNAELGFSVNYPDALEKQAPIKGTIFYAIAATKMPWFCVSLADGATLEGTFKTAFTGNADITAIDVKAAKDGVTASGAKVKIASFKYMYQDTYECEGVVLGTQKNGKWILVSLASVPMYDTTCNPDDYEKILKSFKLN